MAVSIAIALDTIQPNSTGSEPNRASSHRIGRTNLSSRLPQRMGRGKDKLRIRAGNSRAKTCWAGRPCSLLRQKKHTGPRLLYAQPVPKVLPLGFEQTLPPPGWLAGGIIGRLSRWPFTSVTRAAVSSARSRATSTRRRGSPNCLHFSEAQPLIR